MPLVQGFLITNKKIWIFNVPLANRYKHELDYFIETSTLN